MEIGRQLCWEIESMIVNRLEPLREYLEERKKGTERLLFEPKKDYEQLSASLFESVNQLRRDWIFLEVFVKTIIFSGDPAEFESLVGKIDGVVNDIGRKLDLSCDPKYYSVKRLPKMLTTLRNCQRKTDELRNSEELGEAFQDVSKFTIGESLSTFWTQINYCLFGLLPSMWDAGNVVLDEKVNILFSEMEMMIRCNLLYRKNAGNDKELLAHFSSVAWRVAVQCCNFWFNRTDPQVVTTAFVDFYKEIDPSNPQFLQLILRLQESSDVVSFCKYLIGWSKEGQLRKELESLVTLFINNTLEDGGEDVQSFFAEIWAVLAEAAFTYRMAKREEKGLLNPADADMYYSMPTNPLLLAKICLLKAEFFLKECLTNHTPSMTTLTSLRKLSKHQRRQKSNTEYVKQSVVLIDELVNETYSLHSKGIGYPLVKHPLLQLFFKIVFFKAQSSLTDLLNRSSDTAVANDEKDQILSLLDALEYLKTIDMNKLARNSSDDSIIILQVEAFARRITLLSCSFHPQSDTPKLIKAKLRRMTQRFPKSILPKTYELGFIDILGRNIRELLKHDPDSVSRLKDHIEEVLLHLESFKSFLLKVRDSQSELQGESKDLWNHVIEVAYKLEYIVQSIEVDGHDLKKSLWLYDLLQDIKLVDGQVSNIHPMSYAAEIKTPPRIPSRMVSRDTTAEINEMVVGLDDEEKHIVERLTRGSKHRDVVSIVGMPGSGKTTLAGKVYSNRNVIYHFHRRAWCTVSQTYSKRELLLEILSHMPLLTADISQLTEDDLMLKLHRCLLKRKYLIVMDDVWDPAAWNGLKNCFPEGSYGSRILITSRGCDVALKIKPDSIPHSIRLFSNYESWMLLEKRMFNGAVCPGELKETGMEIAEHCRGLPLAVVTIAGVLHRIERSQDSWEEVSKSLSSVIINNPDNGCKEILELSYKHLPEYLKPCFLYLGVFLEDQDIPVSKLMRFWMAEGFIQETESKSLEEVAEDYLLELINSSLVSVSRKRSNGKAKMCRLHDLLRDLCHLKAKEDNFLLLVTRHDEPYASFPDSDYDMEFDSMNQLARPTFESYRLSFCLKRPHFIDSKPSGPGVRSLTFFPSVDSEPKFPHDISFIGQSFKLLRLLDLEYIMAIAFPDEIGLMIQLRYLAISGYMQSIPESIANLWRLETLVVNGFGRKVTLPETIWSMKRLRHLRVNKRVDFMSIPVFHEQVPTVFLLQNLVSFSTPSLSCGEDTLRIFRRLPNLRKLRCIWYSKDCNGFPALDFLVHLESLKIIYYGRSMNSGEFVLPSNLKKLTLSKFFLQGNHLSMIGKLPCLKILKLHAGAFDGQTWIREEEDDQFKELSFLELDSMNIAKWDASHDHLPSLEQLVVRNCKDLEMIPSDFANMATLKTIEVQWCSQSVVESAEKIKEATKEIEVVINCF